MEGENANEFYRECQRNHAANLGNYATDGCGEFLLDQTSPGTLLCAACGCHRNFHRKLSYGANYNRGSNSNQETATEMMEYSGGGDDGSGGGQQAAESPDRMSSKKRLRTKFTPDQKEKMLAFAEKLGWKLQRKDMEDEVERFCSSIGVNRKVFKVWMHNHKNSSSASTSAGNASSLTQ